MAVIYCFSGTGNSLYAARKLAERIGARVEPITDRAATADDGTIGFVFPAFFWNAPKAVQKFMQNLTVTKPDAYVFTVMTCGGSAPGATGAARKYLRGAKASYAAAVKMPENYIPVYKVKNTEKTLLAADEKLERIVRDISGGRGNRKGRLTFLNKLFWRLFPGRDSACDAKFAVSENCAGCGICERICPTANVSLPNGRPEFAHRCELCLSCLHACPAAAIDYKKSVGRKRYIHPKIGVKGLIEFRGRTAGDGE
jgi:ferredoxin